jgi:peroxiredoxin Q/BCP
MSFDSPEDNALFAQKFSFGFQLLSDPDKSIGIAYGAADDASAEYPRRVGVIIGPDGRIVQWHAKVAPASFPTEALAALPG